MSGYIKLISAGVFTAIFVLAVVIFSTQFALDNDSDVNIIDDGRFSDLENTMKSNITTLENESQTSQEMLFKTTLESGDEHSSTGAQFKIGPLTAVSLMIASFNTAFNSIFGTEFNFIAVLFVSMITLMLGYYTIKAWLGRSPD